MCKIRVLRLTHRSSEATDGDGDEMTMPRRLILAMTAGLAFAAIAPVGARHDQPRQAKKAHVVSVETLRSVFDRLFPPAKFDQPGAVYAWTLLFESYAKPECQITMIQYEDDRLEVTVSKFQTRERSLWSHLDDLASLGIRPDDAEALARGVTMERTPVTNTSAARRLLEEFRSLRIPLWLGTGFYLDSDGFDLRVDSRQGVVRITWPATMKHPLADWVGRVQRAFLR